MKAMDAIDLILMMGLGLGLGYAAVSSNKSTDDHAQVKKKKKKSPRTHHSRPQDPKQTTAKHDERTYIYMKRYGSSSGYTKYRVSHNTTFAKLKKAIRHERNLDKDQHIDILYDGRAREGNSLVYKYSGRKLTYKIDGR